MNYPLPSFAAKYFWGDNLQDLDLHTHKKYILQTILEKGDQASLKWLFATFSKEEIKNTLPELKLSKKSAQFWRIYFS